MVWFAGGLWVTVWVWVKVWVKVWDKVWVMADLGDKEGAWCEDDVSEVGEGEELHAEGQQRERRGLERHVPEGEG